MTVVTSNQKRKCGFSSESAKTKAVRTSASNPQLTLVDVKKCYIGFQDPWDHLNEDLAPAIRTSLRKRNANDIALRVDRKQGPGYNRILGSQQSKLLGLKMFATSDGSTWVDHFYDENATSVLEAKTVREAISASLSESAKSRGKSDERGLGPHIALPLIAGVDLISGADQTVSIADARLLALLGSSIRVESAYATIVLLSGVAKMDTADFSILKDMVQEDMVQEDMVHVPLLSLQQALKGQMPATIDALKHSTAERRADTIESRTKCIKPSCGNRDDESLGLLSHTIYVDQNRIGAGHQGGCFIYAGREVVEDSWSRICRDLDTQGTLLSK